jgi:predicted lipoprotein
MTGLCWFFPLFHIRPLGGDTQGGVSFQLANESPTTSEPRKLEAYVTTATEALALWQAFDADPSKAKKELGKQAGLGGAFFFCVRGKGTVESVQHDRVLLEAEGSPRRVCLELGVVVDNTVREAVGVKASQFNNSQDFNALSSDFNRQVEENVIAPNRALLKEGVHLDFVGCCKIGGKSDLDPLCLIPIQLRVAP